MGKNVRAKGSVNVVVWNGFECRIPSVAGQRVLHSQPDLPTRLHAQIPLKRSRTPINSSGVDHSDCS
eukprot:6179013-Pleurochrysis_carterae.AAC.2